MRKFTIQIILLLLISCNAAIAAILSDAETVYLKKDCGSLDNCFTDLDLLSNWINTTRLPNENSPLLVEVGPGSYPGEFTCTNVSSITVNGSGRNNSVLEGGAMFAPSMKLSNCDKLDVSNIKLMGSYGAVQWTGTGITTWTDVDLVGQGRGWYETLHVACTPEETKHYWFGSRVEATPLFGLVTAYNVTCGESWIYSSEILSSATTLDLFGSSWVNAFALEVSNGEAHVYGSVLRTIAKIEGLSWAQPLRGVMAYSGEAHVHGSGIDLISTVNHPLESLVADPGAMIHAYTSAYDLRTPMSGAATRIVNNGGMVMAPFQWIAGATPPQVNSVDGADTFIETDCSSTGCGTPGQEAHMLIYNTSCVGNGPWFDVSTGMCRNP